jgi:hypothetical protein
MLRVKIYKRVVTLEGFTADIELLDVPMVTDVWRKTDDRNFDHLERWVEKLAHHRAEGQPPKAPSSDP